MEYWVYIDGEVSKATYSPDELQELEDFSPETQVCPEDSDEWRKASEVPELQRIFQEQKKTTPDAPDNKDIQTDKNKSEQIEIIDFLKKYSTAQNFGILSSLLIFVGLFGPLINAPVVGSIGYFTHSFATDGIFIALCSVAIFYFSITQKFELNILPSLIVGVIVGYDFYYFNNYGPAPNSGIEQIANIAISMGWGWLALFAGISLSILSVLLKRDSNQTNYDFDLKSKFSDFLESYAFTRLKRFVFGLICIALISLIGSIYLLEQKQIQEVKRDYNKSGYCNAKQDVKKCRDSLFKILTGIGSGSLSGIVGRQFRKKLNQLYLDYYIVIEKPKSDNSKPELKITFFKPENEKKILMNTKHIKR